jgi:DNA (cytosine-5)-methyltransferase 1
MEITPTLDASFGAKHGQDNQHINQGAGLFVPAMAFDSQSAEDHCGLNFKNTKTSMPTHGDQFDNADLICFEANMSLQPAQIGGPYPTLMRTSYASILKSSAVRRLTPVECERLQGFPDNYTAIPWRKKAAEYCPDGPRYKALGNSMAVPVMRWIGERIAAVEVFDAEVVG